MQPRDPAKGTKVTYVNSNHRGQVTGALTESIAQGSK